MKISVVIATYNRRDALRRCLVTLLDENLQGSHCEIVVVVDGSTDGTGEMLRTFRDRFHLVVIEQENKGQAAARNAGANAACGELLLFLDDDLLCEPGLIAAHVSAHERAKSALVMGRIRSVLSPSPSLAEQRMHDDLDKYYSRLIENPQPKWPDNAWAGPNCSVSREAFLAAGSFDEKDFPRRFEDVDLGLRLWKMGIEFRFEPRAVASHPSAKSENQSWTDVAEDGASMIRLVRKHPEMRRHSLLAGMLRAPAWKRHAAKLASNHAAIARQSLDLFVMLFEHLSWLPFARLIATRLAGIKQSVVLLVSAKREAGSWRRMNGLFQERLPVLLYHHVGKPTADTDKFSLTVSPVKFKRQMRWLRWRGFTAITPKQWLGWCTDGEGLPEKPILITFDDAYADLELYAFPVLEEYAMSATIFVITELTRASRVWEGQPLMTVSEIQDWGRRNIDFGGHTRTHPDLTKISVDRAADEIKGSKEDLVDAGLSPVSFAYPFGSFDEKVRSCVDGIFPLAFTCEEGLNDLHTDLLLLRRTMVQPRDTLLDLELRAAFGWSFLSILRARLRIRSRTLRLLRTVKLRS